MLAGMTHETDNPNETKAAAQRDEGLWVDVRYWFNAIIAVACDLKELAHVGVTRSIGVKLCNWLWGVEGAIRRLILAEALKLDPAALANAPPKTKPAPKERKPRKRHPCFRVFGFNRQSEGDAARPSAGGKARPDRPAFWHIAFPSDPLLSIGPR